VRVFGLWSFDNQHSLHCTRDLYAQRYFSPAEDKVPNENGFKAKTLLDDSVLPAVQLIYALTAGRGEQPPRTPVIQHIPGASSNPLCGPSVSVLHREKRLVKMARFRATVLCIDSGWSSTQRAFFAPPDRPGRLLHEGFVRSLRKWETAQFHCMIFRKWPGWKSVTPPTMGYHHSSTSSSRSVLPTPRSFDNGRMLRD